VHDLAHPGARATRRLVSSRFVWPGLATDINQWCRDCQFCQRAKPSPRQKSAVQPIPVPIQHFSHVHVDLVGPLPVSADGYAYLLTAIDRSTHWAEAIPLKATSAADCAEAFIGGWVSRFGVPATLTSDRGVQFTSSFWAAVTGRLGVRHNTTTAFHPQSNGMVERFHRRLKEALKARAASTDWPAHLPWVLLGLRTAPREESGVSAAELVYGSPLSVPGQLLSAAEPPPEQFVRQLQSGVLCAAPLQPRGADADSQALSPLPELRTAEFVYVKVPPSAPFLSPAFRGPYTVHKRAAKFFIIKIGGGRYDAVSVDRLKPHLGSPVYPASPPKRGRPPGRSSR
jgi:transposase InsO family protein